MNENKHIQFITISNTILPNRKKIYWWMPHGTFSRPVISSTTWERKKQVSDKLPCQKRQSSLCLQ